MSHAHQSTAKFSFRSKTKYTKYAVICFRKDKVAPNFGGAGGGGGREEISPLNIKRLGFDINELHAAHRSSG